MSRSRLRTAHVALVAIALAAVVAAASMQAEAKAAQSDAGHVALTPARGPVGTRVTFEGEVDPALAGVFQRGSYFALSSEFGDCELIVGLNEKSVDIDDDGHLRGSFVVGDEGGCFQTDQRRRAEPGAYSFILGCHSCALADFEITTSELAHTGASPALLTALGLAIVTTGAAMCLASPRRDPNGPSRTSSMVARDGPHASEVSAFRSPATVGAGAVSAAGPGGAAGAGLSMPPARRNSTRASP